MNLLQELGIKYGTDKIGKHNYLPTYSDLFDDSRDKVKKVVEMGIAEGASLFMWRDYFPNATIYGADIDQKRVESLLGETRDRIQVIQCDQSSVKDLGNLLEKIGFDVDLFIDDGSHNPADQLLTCLTLMPYFNEKVTYVIEDVDDASVDAIKQILEEKYEVEVRHVGSRHDDRLMIVRHENG